MMMRTSSPFAALSHIFGRSLSEQALPTFVRVARTLSSLMSQPHFLQSREAFSYEPVSHAVETILSSSRGDRARLSPRQNTTLNGHSNFPDVWHLPQKSFSSTIPYGVRMPDLTVRPSLSGFPSLPVLGSASATFCTLAR